MKKFGNVEAVRFNISRNIHAEIHIDLTLGYSNASEEPFTKWRRRQ